MISFINVLSKLKAPSKIENTKNAKIVKRNPIKNPLIRPFSLCFFIPINTPKKMETPLITWLTGEMTESEMEVKRRTNAKIRIPRRAVNNPTATPLRTQMNSPPFFSLLLNAFTFIIASFLVKQTKNFKCLCKPYNILCGQVIQNDRPC